MLEKMISKAKKKMNKENYEKFLIEVTLELFDIKKYIKHKYNKLKKLYKKLSN